MISNTIDIKERKEKKKSNMLELHCYDKYL